MNRDIIEAQRAGYVAGARAVVEHQGLTWCRWDQEKAETQARQRYPVTRPRVLKHGSTEYKVEDGELWIRWPEAPRYVHDRMRWRKRRDMTRASLSELVALFDNPNETVEE